MFTESEDGWNWSHYHDLKGECPTCGRSAHVGVSDRDGTVFWLHDDYGAYKAGRYHEPCEIEYGEFDRMLYEAERKAILKHRKEEADAGNPFGEALATYLKGLG